MEHYSAVRKKEILPFCDNRDGPEGIMLSEISPREKDRYCTYDIYMETKRGKLRGTGGVERWLPEAGDGGDGEILLKGHKLILIRLRSLEI